MPEKGCDYLVPDETIIPQFISCESHSLVEKVERTHEEGSVDQSRDTVKSVVQGCAVETRASAMKPRIVKPLVVPGVVVAESSEGRFEDDQRKDSQRHSRSRAG